VVYSSFLKKKYGSNKDSPAVLIGDKTLV